TVYDRENKRERPKTDFVVTGDMKYVWINADDPSDRIEIPWQYMGQQDDISKAFGSALTYTERYFLMKFFTVYDRENKRERPKTDFVVTGDMKYVWINADDPSDRIEIPWQYMGQQDDISKAFGSALTYTERYFLMKFFSVPTDEDDPDARDTKEKQNGQLDKNGKNKKASENQLKYIDALISRRVTADWTKERLYEKLKETMGVDKEPSEWTVEEASKAISIITGRFE
ncbi:ERF family protein, partial [Geobacillus thermoleovorans]|uniref:ERF family protein n=1 Tax=Geobacillus thermoleovorans TaxID=33941 RepID=UPI001A998F63